MEDDQMKLGFHLKARRENGRQYVFLDTLKVNEHKYLFLKRYSEKCEETHPSVKIFLSSEII